MCLVGKADDVSVSGRTKRRRDVMGRGGVEQGVPEHSHCSSISRMSHLWQKLC